MAVTIDSVAEVSRPLSGAWGEFRLRPLRRDDAAAWSVWLADPRVTEHTSYPAIDLPFVEGMLSRQLDGYATGTSRRWAIADEADRLIGTCGYSSWSLPHAHAELVYDLAPAYWGRGVMRAAVHEALAWAFETAQFNRVHAFVMTTNAPSIAVLKRAGFEREGTLRQYRIARGVARDFHVYARLRDSSLTAEATR